MTMTRSGSLATPNASKYLQQLLKHFAHKVEVSYTETEGRAMLGTGPVDLVATPEELRVTLTAPDAAGLDRAAEVIDSHLVRFAFREGFEKMDWAA